MERSYPSISSVKRFSIHENCEERCYLGIALPQEIRYLFLDHEDQPLNLDKFPILNEEDLYSVSDLKIVEDSGYTKHDVDMCLSCSCVPEKRDDFLLKVADLGT